MPLNRVIQPRQQLPRQVLPPINPSIIPHKIFQPHFFLLRQIAIVQVGVQQHNGKGEDVHSVFCSVSPLGAIDLEEATREGIEDPIEHLGLAGHADIVDEQLRGARERGREGARGVCGGKRSGEETNKTGFEEQEEMGYEKETHSGLQANTSNHPSHPPSLPPFLPSLPYPHRLINRHPLKIVLLQQLMQHLVGKRIMTTHILPNPLLTQLPRVLPQKPSHLPRGPLQDTSRNKKLNTRRWLLIKAGDALLQQPLVPGSGAVKDNGPGSVFDGFGTP